MTPRRRDPVDFQYALPGPLTKREHDVLDCLWNEQMTKEIAHTLGVTIKMVEAYRSNLYRRTETRTVIGLMKVALRKGWVQL